MATAFAHAAVPLGDRPQNPLLPPTVFNLPARVNGELAYLFESADGAQVAHVVGAFRLTVGEADGLRLAAREGVVWILPATDEDTRMTRLEVLLWRDGEVREPAGTLTTGPALLVTFATTGGVDVEVDDLAYQSSAESAAVRQGEALRVGLREVGWFDGNRDSALRVLDAAGAGPSPKAAALRPVVHFRSDGDIEGPIEVDGHRAMSVVGGAYFSRGVPGGEEFLQIRADAAVAFLPPGSGTPGTRSERGEERSKVAGGAEGPLPDTTTLQRQALGSALGEMEVEAVYLEGDVVMTQGPNMVRASRLYYDFVQDKALMADAVVRANLVERNLPLYLRAAEIRQLSANQFSARGARLTTSEFHTPHYHVGARRVELTNRTPPSPTGVQRGVRAGTFAIEHATLNLGGVPVAYWPSIRGGVDTSETAIRSVRSGYSDDFGVEMETEWHFFHALGLETPEGFDTALSLDSYSRRGPAVGLDADYQRDTYFGLLRSYLLFDSDDDFLGREREVPGERDVRGRFLLRYRQYLEEDWQVSLELSYISDKGFLEEFFESEFDNEKDQETLLYLKKQQDVRAFTALLQTRPLDFTTQTERSPDLGYWVIGESLGERATWYSENRAGLVRYRPADQTFRELLREGRRQGSGTVLRTHSRQEVSAPLDLGPVRVVPFASLRGGAWDDSPVDGGVARVLGTYGLRASTYLSRVWPQVRSALWDFDGLRHVIKSDLVAFLSHSNRDGDEFFPFDATVEPIEEIDGAAWGLRQRWQTHRGTVKNRRTVDVVTWDLETGFFNDTTSRYVTNGFTSYSRPEASLGRNFVNSSLIWRVNDRTAVLSEMNYDVNDGELDILNVSLAVERSPRFSYLLGYRFIEEADSNLLGFDMNYSLTEKHSIAVRERFDLERGRTLDFTVALIRKLPRWFAALSFELDEPEDDFGISISIWPEGLPRAALGSRRFTGLGRGVSLQGE